jgi:hypothetical protein
MLPLRVYFLDSSANDGESRDYPVREGLPTARPELSDTLE